MIRQVTPRDRERTCVTAQDFPPSRLGPAECDQDDPALASYRAKKRHFLHTTQWGAVFGGLLGGVGR